LGIAERPKAAESGCDGRWCSHVAIRVSTVLTCGGSERDPCPVAAGHRAGPGHGATTKNGERRATGDERKEEDAMGDGDGEGGCINSSLKQSTQTTQSS